MKNHPLQSYYSRIYKRYDLINHIFTFGLDKKWRHTTVEICLSTRPQKILDLCCGTGDLAIGLAKASQNSVHITGYDLNAGMLQRAASKAEHLGISSIDFVRGDVSSMPFPDETYDAVTIGFGFRNLMFENAERDMYLKEISRVLKSGGSLYILESSRPDNKVAGFLYHLYLKCFLIPVGGIISGNMKAYRYLAGSSSGFYSFHQICDLLKEFFEKVSIQRIFLFGAANLIVAIRKKR